MKKLAVMSDLHLDHNIFEECERDTLLTVLKKEGIEHLHIAGDLANDFQGVAQPFLHQLSQHIDLSFNLGNHDMLELKESTINSLDGGIVFLGEVNLVHLAGWYDYSFHPEMTEEATLADKKLFWFDRKLKRTQSDPQLTQASLQKLEQLLQESPKPTIVALHFVPHNDFIPDHPYFHRFRAFLGSQAFHKLFLKYQVKSVVFGHLHHHHNRVIEGIHYQARPLGYKREWKMIGSFLKQHPYLYQGPNYQLNKRFRTIKDLPAFQQFYREHLADEFRQAMTIFSKTP